MDNPPSECKGCYVYDEELKWCSMDLIPYISKTQKCPCLKCLIKMMCKSECEEYQIYSGLANHESTLPWEK